MSRRLILAGAVALCAVAGAAQAKMVCTEVPGLGQMPGETVMNKVCHDDESGRAAAVALFCRYHPSESHCAALGWHPSATDPLDQRIDQREVDRFCQANPGLGRCINPFQGAGQ